MGTTTGRKERSLPRGPPWGYKPRERLDHEHTSTTLGVRKKTRQQAVARGGVQFVDGECSDNRAPLRQYDLRDILDTRPASQAEEAVGFARFFHGPRMAIDAVDGGIGPARARPCGPGRSRPTSEVDDFVDGRVNSGTEATMCWMSRKCSGP